MRDPVSAIWRARTAGGALLALLLAGCQPLPRVLADTAPPPDAPIMMLKDSRGIEVAPISGLDGELSDQLAEAMAGALREADVPASTDTRNRGSYTLLANGETRPLSAGRVAVALHWELRAPDGGAAGRYEQRFEVNKAAWDIGNPELLATVSQSAAPRIAKLLEEEGIVAVDDGAQIVVPQVKGAPGDGPRSLARAMINALQRANLAVAEDGQAAAGRHFTVAGSVATTPAGPGQQKITISWKLLAADGSTIGEVKQENAIPVGTLNHAWGDVAFAVANSAAPGITALLERLKMARSGP